MYNSINCPGVSECVCVCVGVFVILLISKRSTILINSDCNWITKHSSPFKVSFFLQRGVKKLKRMYICIEELRRRRQAEIYSGKEEQERRVV